MLRGCVVTDGVVRGSFCSCMLIVRRPKTNQHVRQACRIQSWRLQGVASLMERSAERRASCST